jgi:hypothetical protein
MQCNQDAAAHRGGGGSQRQHRVLRYFVLFFGSVFAIEDPWLVKASAPATALTQKNTNVWFRVRGGSPLEKFESLRDYRDQ